jgi:hypothetical protein
VHPPQEPAFEPPAIKVPPTEPTAGDPVTPPLGAESPEAPAEPQSPAGAALAAEPPALDSTAAPPASSPSAVATELIPVIEPTIATAVSAGSDFEAVASGESSEPMLGSETETKSSLSASGVTEATFQSLAAAGFVSPGRPSVAATETDAETIDAETPPAEETPAESIADDAGSAAIAAYWRWMHARLDAHLQETQIDDLGAPSMHLFRPFPLSWDSALDALEPARSVGVRDRAAFDARAFDGLRDGFVHLG